MSLVSVSRLLTNQNLPTGGLYDLLFMDFPDGYGSSRIRFSPVDLSNDSYYVTGVKAVFIEEETVAGNRVRYYRVDTTTSPFKADDTPYTDEEMKRLHLNGVASSSPLVPGPSNGFSRATTGLQKLVQMFLKVLLTTAGTDPLYPDRGTQVFSRITRGNITDPSYLASALKADIQSAAEQVKTLTTNFSSNDEVLDSVDILKVLVQDYTIYVAMSLTSASGITVAFYAPFPLLDMNLNIF